MAQVKILEVSCCMPTESDLLAAHVEAPATGTVSELTELPIAGWAVGRSRRVAGFEILPDEPLLGDDPFWQPEPLRWGRARQPRPDLAKRFPHVAHAGESGFCTVISLLGLPPKFELLLRAVFDGGPNVPIARIRGERQPLRGTHVPSIQPLMLSCLGRTGSTWAMRLLMEHPDILAHRAYPYETRAAGCWMQTLRVLAQPVDEQLYEESVVRANQLRVIGPNPYIGGLVRQHPAISRWASLDYPGRLAGFCLESVESFYREIARCQSELPGRYFMEKWGIGSHQWMMWELCPQAREVFLVRDPRDVICSMLAFNGKRGMGGFGRDRRASDEEFIRSLRVDMVNLMQEYRRRVDRAHLLRYEDLVLQPRQTVRAVLEYLDLDSSDATIDRMLAAAAAGAEQLRGHQTAGSPRASICRWRRDLSPQLQEICEESFADVGEAFGYEQ